MQVGQQEEHALLEEIRAAFGAKHVVRVCGSTSDGAAVLDGARRLLEHAETIKRSGVDLRGASLAIDDCYEVWGSGFISIPYNFELQDLQPQLTRLLGAGDAASGAQAVAAATAAGEGEGGGARRRNTVAACFRRGAAAGGQGWGGEGRAPGAFGGWRAGCSCAGAAPWRQQQRGRHALPVALCVGTSSGGRAPPAVAVLGRLPRGLGVQFGGSGHFARLGAAAAAARLPGLR